MLMSAAPMHFREFLAGASSTEALSSDETSATASAASAARGQSVMPHACTASVALDAVLGAERVAKLAEAGVDEYITGMLDDGAGEDEADLSATLGPLLLDTGVAEDEAAAGTLSLAILRKLRGAIEGAPAAAPVEEPQLRKLAGHGVSMFELVAADEAKAIAEAKAEIGEVRVNLNTTISHGGPVNTLIEEDCSEEAMARRFKQARRGEQQLKREADCD